MATPSYRPVGVAVSPWQVGIFLFPVLLFVALVGIYLIKYDTYRFLEDSEGPLEFVQANSYFVALALGAAAMVRARRANDKPAFWLMGIFTLGTFFVFGEEIEWGRRILGFDTPEFFLRHNGQRDITLHNLNLIEGRKLHHKAFLIVGLYGTFAWLVASRINLRKEVLLLVPPWFLSLYFAPVAIWYGCKFLSGSHQESAETFLAIGVLLMAAHNLSGLLDRGARRARVLNP
jgi:hypothetical protein